VRLPAVVVSLRPRKTSAFTPLLRHRHLSGAEPNPAFSLHPFHLSPYRFTHRPLATKPRKPLERLSRQPAAVRPFIPSSRDETRTYSHSPADRPYKRKCASNGTTYELLGLSCQSA
jgi:hypothetical protein